MQLADEQVDRMDAVPVPVCEQSHPRRRRLPAARRYGVRVLGAAAHLHSDLPRRWRKGGLGYIRIKGPSFQHAGNAFPPPQRGLVSTAGGHHWIIEDNTIEWANGVGLDIGAQRWTGARDPQAGDSHIVAHNLIGRCDNVGVWPVLRPERNNAGSGREHEIHDNDAVEWLDLAAWRARGWDQGGSVAKLDVNFDADRLELTVKGEADLPKVPMVRIVKSGSGGR
jgi:hypothetical protein